MKLSMTVVLTFLVGVIVTAPAEATGEGTGIRLVYSPGLAEVSDGLINAFMKKNPDARVSMSALDEKGLQGSLQEGAMALVTKEYITPEVENIPFRVVVGRDVIVPVISTDNPYLEAIMQQGISPGAFSRIYGSGGATWGELAGMESGPDVIPVLPAGNAARAYLAEFTGTGQGSLKGLEVEDAGEMPREISSGRYAIGFVSLADAANTRGITMVPVDRNGNGKVDWFEDVYETSGELTHAIFLGKYPGSLYSRIYLLADRQPSGQEELAFLEWMLGEGQETMAMAGLTGIDYSESHAGLQMLRGQNQASAEVPVISTLTRNTLLVTGGILILLVLTGIFLGRSGRKGVHAARSGAPGGAFSIDSGGIPAGLYFDKSHTWVFLEKDGKVRLGIDDFMPRVTGKVTRIIVKNPGEQLKKGEPFMMLVQQGKKLQVSAPVSGTIAELNEKLLRDASMVNADPYGEGWVCLVQPSNWLLEIKSFLMREPYTGWIKTELSRLKDFFTSVMNQDQEARVALVMQDGGEVIDGPLEDLGPEAWEEFQTQFINKSLR
jgi:glycine cleavage system H lipoate-binding protein/ABC-type phosphate transport system substrate-binding protein